MEISPATIEPPRATIPANRIQPAMVLKRSSMGLPRPDAEARNGFARSFSGRLAVHQAAEPVLEQASGRWRSAAAAGRLRPAIAAERGCNLVAGEPAGVVELRRVDASARRSAPRRCSRSSATRERARAGWRRSGRRVTAMPASSCKLAGDRRLDRFRRARGSRRAPNSGPADIAAGGRAAAGRHARRA